jgi:asparagine synthase (glutamine-hydrolysing)
LSSGYDSSLCAIRLKEICDNVNSYTIGFSERRENENNLTNKIAKHLDLKHKDILISSNQFLDTIEQWVRQHAEPWSHPNGLSSYLAFREIRKSTDNAIVFDGAGGDSLFRDFTSIGPSIMALNILYRIPPHLKGILNSLETSIHKARARKIISKINRIIAGGPIGYMVFHNHWVGDYYKGLTGSEFNFKETIPGKEYYSGGKDIKSKYKAYYRSVGFDSSIRRSVMEARFQGMRTTFPLEDFNLVELLANIPREKKFRVWRKRYLQEKIVQRRIPKNYLSSRKRAIESPLGIILSTPKGEALLKRYLTGNGDRYHQYYKREYVENILSEFLNGNTSHSAKLWNILIFEIWAEQYLS